MRVDKYGLCGLGLWSSRNTLLCWMRGSIDLVLEAVKQSTLCCMVDSVLWFTHSIMRIA